MKQFEFEELKRRIDFHYNGDLGALHHKTEAYYQMLWQLLELEQITKEQFDELAETLVNHFKSGLQYAINNPLYYVR